MQNNLSIKYNQIWANLYIVISVFCMIVFLFGVIVLQDLTILIYALATIGPLYVGLKMRKSHYAIISKNKIQIFGLLGQLKKEYVLNRTEKFITINNRIYLRKNKIRIKVKMNNWFVNQYDWNRVLDFFLDNENIIKHLVDD